MIGSIVLRPTILLLLQRLWQGGAGLVTVLVLAHSVSPIEQGWYYSFLSLAAIYTLFDLGLSLVLAQNAAYSATDVRWEGGHLQGPGTTRLAALFAFAARHYLRLGGAFLLVMVPLGLVFFWNAAPTRADWPLVWIVLVLGTTASLLILPLYAIVEGSGEVAAIAGIRLVQGVIGSILTWIVLLAGGALWATVMMPLAAVVCGTVWLVGRRQGVVTAVTQADHRLIDWKSEIWPLQWRLGLSWLSGYLLTQVHTIVLFSLVGGVAAGQMGLSLTIGNMIGLVAQAFIARHIPAMAKAAAQRQWSALDGLFRTDIAVSAGVYIAGAIAVLGGAVVLSSTPYADRMLPPALFAILLLALFLGHIQGALAAQLRSYRREPLLWISIAGAALTLLAGVPAVLIHGAAGIVSIMALVQALLVVPISIFLFYRRNREWRK